VERPSDQTACQHPAGHFPGSQLHAGHVRHHAELLQEEPGQAESAIPAMPQWDSVRQEWQADPTVRYWNRFPSVVAHEGDESASRSDPAEARRPQGRTANGAEVAGPPEGLSDQFERRRGEYGLCQSLDRQQRDGRCTPGCSDTGRSEKRSETPRGMLEDTGASGCFLQETHVRGVG